MQSWIWVLILLPHVRMISEFLPNDSECPFPHWKDGVGHVPRGQRDGVMWWIMCVLGPRGMWGGQGQRTCTEQSLCGISSRVSLLPGDCCCLRLSASWVLCFQSSRNGPCSLGSAGHDCPCACLPAPSLSTLWKCPGSSFTIWPRRPWWVHTADPALSSHSLLSEGPRGCSAAVLVSMKASPCHFLWPASLLQIPLGHLSPCILSLVHSFLCLAVITGCCGFPLCLTLCRAGAPGELELLSPESVSLISRNFFLHSWYPKYLLGLGQSKISRL